MSVICIFSMALAVVSLAINFIVRKDLETKSNDFLHEVMIIKFRIDEIKEKIKPTPVYVVKTRKNQYIKSIEKGDVYAHFTIVVTEDVLEAKSFDVFEEAKDTAEYVNGTVLKYERNLEVVE